MRKRSNPHNSKDYNELLKDISSLAKQFSIFQKEAEKLGVFTESRDLLECKKCKLMEDVLCDGRLVTYYSGEKIHDTGLRFKQKTKKAFYCPNCGANIICTS